MKSKILTIIIATGFFLFANNAFAQGYQRVNGYFKNNGTYIQPHFRTRADGNPYNNYGSSLNAN